MNNCKHYIGADISKKTLDICVLKGKEKLFHLRVSNDEKGLKVLEEKLKENGVVAEKALLCLENTGSYGDKLSRWATQNSYPVWVENAVAIKRSLGLARGKNDEVDAHRIALYAARFEDQCKLWQVPREQIQRLQKLNATRTRLINSRSRLATPLKESASILSKDEQKEIESCCASALKGLDKSIKEVEKKIDQLIKSDSKLSHMVKIITSVEGVGMQIAIAFILTTKEFKEVETKKKMACYAGVAPFEHTSGTSVKGRSRVSHFANKSLKSLLHMGALSAIKNSEELRAYYERKVKEGKPKMVVINAIRNKLISRIYACIKQDRLYEKKYVRKVS